MLQMSAFASSIPLFADTTGSANVNHGGHGVTYIEELDIFAAWGGYTDDSDAAPFYTSKDGIKWTSRLGKYIKSTVIAFAYGDDKGIVVPTVGSTVSSAANEKIFVTDKYLNSAYSVYTVLDTDPSGSWVRLRSSIMWDEYTKKFWSGGVTYDTAQGAYTGIGLYYSDGEITEETLPNGNTGKVMKWTKTPEDVFSQAATAVPTYVSNHHYVMNWIRSDGAGHILAGTGYYYTSPDSARNSVLMVDATNEGDYEFKVVKMTSYTKTGNIDKYGNVVFSVVNGSNIPLDSSYGVYKSTWSELWDSASRTPVTHVNGETYKTNELLEFFLVTDNMILGFPQRVSTSSNTKTETYAGDIKVISYKADNTLANTLTTLFNTPTTAGTSVMQKFLSESGMRMNSAAVNKNGVVVAMTGKPHSTSYSYALNKFSSKILVFDINGLSIDSEADSSAEIERTLDAQIITTADDSQSSVSVDAENSLAVVPGEERSLPITWKIYDAGGTVINNAKIDVEVLDYDGLEEYMQVSDLNIELDENAPSGEFDLSLRAYSKEQPSIFEDVEIALSVSTDADSVEIALPEEITFGEAPLSMIDSGINIIIDDNKHFLKGNLVKWEAIGNENVSFTDSGKLIIDSTNAQDEESVTIKSTIFFGGEALTAQKSITIKKVASDPMAVIADELIAEKAEKAVDGNNVSLTASVYNPTASAKELYIVMVFYNDGISADAVLWKWSVPVNSDAVQTKEVEYVTDCTYDVVNAFVLDAETLYDIQQN